MVHTTITIRYTTAPSIYDGCGTQTLGHAGMLDVRPLRKVAIETKHLAWQEAQYASGYFHSFTEAQFQALPGRR